MALFLHIIKFMTTHKRSKKKSRPVCRLGRQRKNKTLAVCMIVKNEAERLPLILGGHTGSVG